MDVKTQFCDQCKHGQFVNRRDDDIRLVCTVGHRPKFFAPRFEMDHIWGYKRKCDDFIAASFALARSELIEATKQS